LRDPELISRLSGQLAVYLVADPAQSARPIEDIVAQALDGGATCVQLRAKSMTDREAIAIARRLRDRCRRFGALFVVNDRVDIALAAGADGAHLGVDDLPIEDARRLGGPEFVIGYSPETDEQAAKAARLGADYLGVGPVFGTASKADAGEPIGLESLRRRVTISGVPVVGIGGVTARNAGQVIDSGAAGVAVMSAILGASNPRQATEKLYSAVRSARGSR